MARQASYEDVRGGFPHRAIPRWAGAVGIRSPRFASLGTLPMPSGSCASEPAPPGMPYRAAKSAACLFSVWSSISGLKVEGRTVRAVHVDRHRVMLVHDLPDAVVLAQPER